MPTKHNRWGGSTATRTIHCPAWVNLADAAPAINRVSSAAERGSALHDVMEAIYTTDHDGDLNPFTADLSDEDKKAVQEAYDATETVLNEFGATDFICEAFVELREDIGGSADMIACSEDAVLVVDYKFGYQTVTHVDQFMFYAICGQETAAVADMFEGRTVYSVIIQPAAFETTNVRLHDPQELADFKLRLLASVEVAEQGADTGNPGDHCAFCPAAPYCPAKREQTMSFLNFDPKAGQDIAAALDLLDQIKQQIKAVETESQRLLEQGHQIPGYKLVAKQARRKWTDEALAITELGRSRKWAKEDYLDTKLKTVAQIEKIAKAKDFSMNHLSDCWEKSSSGYTVAPETDKRDAVPVNMPEALSKVF